MDLLKYFLPGKNPNMHITFPKSFCRVLLLFAWCTPLYVSAQKLADVKWSEWVPISDHNENKVLFSFAYAKFGAPNEVDQKRLGLKWYFRIKNDYKEDISGRFCYEYQAVDGSEHISSYPLHCMPGKSIVSNELLFVTNVEKLLNIYFVTFSPCASGGQLLSFTPRDTIVFRLKEAMIAQQVARVQHTGAATANASVNAAARTADFSDGKVIYHGENEKIIKQLLSQVKGWRTNSGLTVQDGIPPQVPVDNPCQRDQYVYSAVLFAWAAESYYRIGENQKSAAAADKVRELIQTVQSLCGGGPAYISGSCTTMRLYPCGEAGDRNAPIAAGTSTGASQHLTGQRQQAVTANYNNSANKEKDLLYNLLPVAAAMGSDPKANTMTDALSGFMNKFDQYVADNDELDTGVKLFLRLSNLNTMNQLRELSGDNAKYKNFVQQIAPGYVSTPPGGINDLAAVLNRPMSQMSTTEIRQQIESLWNTIGSLIESGLDENGLTARRESKLADRYDDIRRQDKQLKATYGYDTEDFKYAIRNFDDALLDKILDKNFPFDLPIVYSERTESSEQATNFVYERLNLKYAPKPIHYAAKYGNAYAVKKLMAKGADPNERAGFHSMYGLAQSGAAPIEFGNCKTIALAFNRYEALKYLLDTMHANEPFDKGNLTKKDVLDIAHAWKNDEMVDLIKDHFK